MHNIRKSLTAISLLFTGIIAAQSPAKKVVADKILAVVGDRIILQSDIKNSIENATAQGDVIPAGAGCILMKQALTSKVFMLQGEKDSLLITDEDVEAELDQKIRHYIKILGSREKLEEYAGKTIYQIKDDARESVKENKLAAAMQQKIVNNVKITPTEVIAFFDRMPKDSLPFIESKFEVGQITIIPQSSKELEKYIVAELNNYKRQIENKVTTFEQLALRYSEHFESKNHGGSYQINRNEKAWDPAILLASFRLKTGEISVPVKSDKSEYFLIQMVKRRGDDADIRLIMRTPPVTDAEINHAKGKLDTIRSKIIAGAIDFNKAAAKYSNDQTEKFLGPFLFNRDGSPYVTISQMDNELVVILDKMKVGEISTPIPFTTDQGRKAVHIVYLKSRSEPHRMNLNDDYSEIAQAALEEKKEQALNKWIKSKMPAYYIMVDDNVKMECPNLQEYASSDIKGF